MRWYYWMVKIAQYFVPGFDRAIGEIDEMKEHVSLPELPPILAAKFSVMSHITLRRALAWASRPEQLEAELEKFNLNQRMIEIPVWRGSDMCRMLRVFYCPNDFAFYAESWGPHTAAPLPPQELHRAA